MKLYPYLKLNKKLNLPSPTKIESPFSEIELKSYMEKLSTENVNVKTHKYFIGADTTTITYQP